MKKLFSYLDLTKEEIEKGAELIKAQDVEGFNEFVYSLNVSKSIFKKHLLNVDAFCPIISKVIKSGNIDKALKLYSVGLCQSFSALMVGYIKVIAAFLFIVLCIPLGFLIREPAQEQYQQENMQKCESFATELETEWKYVNNECWFMIRS